MTGATQLCLLVLALCGCGRLAWGFSSFPQEGPSFQKREQHLFISNFSHPCMDTWKCVAEKLNFQQLMKPGGVSLAALSASDVIDPLCSQRLPAAQKCLEASPSPNCTLKSSFLDLIDSLCRFKDGLKAGRLCWDAADVGKRHEPCMATFLAAPKNGDRCGLLSTLRTCLVKKLQATSTCSKEDIGVAEALVSDSISRFCPSEDDNSN